MILLPTLLLPCGTTAIADGFRLEPLAVAAAPGSRSPNLVSGNGRLVLSWMEPREDGHGLRFSVLGEDRWEPPRTVAEGRNWFVNWADFPSVVPIDGSLWAAHWLVRQPAGGYAYDIHLSVSRDAGESWSDPVLPHDDGTPTEHGFVTLYPEDGDLALIWLDGRNMADADQGAHGPNRAHGTSGGMTLRHATWSDGLRAGTNTEIDSLVCDCCATDVAITDSGPVAVYRNRTSSEVRDIYAMRRIDGAWQASRPIADDGWVIGGCPVNGPAIAADGSNVAVAWFTGAGGRARVRLARSGDSGATFGEPIEIADGETFGRAGIALLPGGGVAVSWLCKVSETSARVCLREVGADGSAGALVHISGERSVPVLNVPQLARHGNDLFAAWTAEVDGQTTIEAVRISYDNRSYSSDSSNSSDRRARR